MCVKEEEDVVFIRKVANGNDMLFAGATERDAGVVSVSVRLFANLLGRETIGQDCDDKEMGCDSMCSSNVIFVLFYCILGYVRGSMSPS